MTTTEILNATNSVQSRIDTVLGSMDRELDWQNDSGWQPGDPVHTGPGCRPRRLLEVIDEWSLKPRREPCQVRWSGDAPCWMCGQERPRLIYTPPSLGRAAEVLVAVDVSPFVAALEQMARSLGRADLEPFQRHWLNHFKVADQDDEPLSRPAPLPIDGRAYRRRIKRRTR